MLRPFHEHPRNKAIIMISAGEGKGRTIILRLKVYGVTLLAPDITSEQGKQHGRQNKNAYWENNYQ